MNIKDRVIVSTDHWERSKYNGLSGTVIKLDGDWAIVKFNKVIPLIFKVNLFLKWELHPLTD